MKLHLLSGRLLSGNATPDSRTTQAPDCRQCFGKRYTRNFYERLLGNQAGGRSGPRNPPIYLVSRTGRSSRHDPRAKWHVRFFATKGTKTRIPLRVSGSRHEVRARMHAFVSCSQRAFLIGHFRVLCFALFFWRSIPTRARQPRLWSRIFKACVRACVRASWVCVHA